MLDSTVERAGDATIALRDRSGTLVDWIDESTARSLIKAGKATVYRRKQIRAVILIVPRYQVADHLPSHALNRPVAEPYVIEHARGDFEHANHRILPVRAAFFAVQRSVTRIHATEA